MFDTSQFDVIHDMVSDIELLDPNHPVDSAALLPFVGAPFAYHQWRSGRANWESTVAALMIGVGVTEGGMYFAGRSAGFTSTELLLGRGMAGLGFTYGGRHYTLGLLMQPKNPKGLGWRVPSWVLILAAYETTMWWGRRIEGAHGKTDEFGKPIDPYYV